MQQITGNFKQCIFKSSSYVVGLFKVKDTSSDIVRLKNKTITFTGYFDSLNEHDLYTFYGNIVIHDRYGEQFQVDSYEIVLPKEKDKIIDFLSSNLFHKIGKRKASKIVEVLGEDALKVILENKDSLWLVPTLTKENIDTIYEALSKYRNSYEVIVNLTKIGFSMKEALRVYKEYKANTMDIINTDPYTLVRDIKEITFTRVDKLRSKFDIKDDDSRRIDAGIVYAINEVNQNIGNSYLSYDEVIYYTNRALNINNSDLIMEGINRLLDLDILVLDDNNILLKEMYVALENIAKRVVDLTKSKSNVKVSSSDIKDLERLYNINYNKEQFNAICGAIENNIMIITGGPGVGKTTVIKGICSLYQNIYKIDFRTFVNEVALLAPTGRACKRIQEQTNFPASTIHRFLKWNKDEDTFLVNESNKSDVKLVIIDEVSMLDIYLFHNLLLGLRPMTKIILIGDYNQLPSVGCGQILKDLIDSDLVLTIKLEKLYRQKEESNINMLAYQINHDLYDSNIFNEKDDLLFIPANFDNLKDKLKEVLDDYNLNYDSLQIMAPIYRGDNGIDELNYFVQSIVNPKARNKKEIIHNAVTYRENDRVLNVVNMPDENVYNGDVGTILEIGNSKEKYMLVDFDGNIVRLTLSNFSNLKLGYVISVHKSQGSEFDVVILPILPQYGIMLYRKLLYTAITRAKKKLILIGDIYSFAKGINNHREDERKTNLKKLLNSCINS